MSVMNPVATLLAFALVACASAPPALPSPDAGVRPVVARDNLDGEWKLVRLNDQPYDGSLTFAGPSVRFRFCNTGSGRLSRNGDKLIVGAPFQMTEMACVDPLVPGRDREAEALAVLRLPMTMELTPPDRLRLVNEAGSLDLVRTRG